MLFELVIAVAGTLVIGWLARGAIGRRRSKAQDWMPAELRMARLAYAEQLFRSTGPVAVSAKVDRAYRDRAGAVTLVELKTRKADKVYLSDVIELSAQRLALHSQTGEKVSEHGYVVVQRVPVGPTRQRAHRVKLLADEQISFIVTRRERLLIQAETPGPPRSAALCEHCTYLSECDWGRAASGSVSAYPRSGLGATRKGRPRQRPSP